MKPRYLLYLGSFLTGVSLEQIGEHLGRRLDTTATVGLVGVLVLATLLGHRRQLRPANTRTPGLTVTLLVSLTVTTLAFIGYVTDVFIRGGGR